jgi:hypothetical protein
LSLHRSKASGIAEVVQALVDHLPEMAPDLDFLLLKHPAASARLSEAENVTEQVVRQPANGPATMWYLPYVAGLTGVDLFHATFNIMPAGLSMPCVTTVHDLMWLTQPALCSARFKGKVERFFYGHGIRRALNRAAALATVSTATRDDIAAYCSKAGARSFVTLSGVSPDFRPQPAEPNLFRSGWCLGGAMCFLSVSTRPTRTTRARSRASRMPFRTVRISISYSSSDVVPGKVCLPNAPAGWVWPTAFGSCPLSAEIHLPRSTAMLLRCCIPRFMRGSATRWLRPWHAAVRS